MTEDSTLLHRYATEDAEDAFRELVQRRFGLVYAVALRQVGGDEHLARDVAQQVFQELARQAPALARRTVLSGWLYCTARFTAIDLVRAERRRRVREEQARLMHELAPDSGSDTDWKNLRPLLDDALSELKERDRDAVMLRLFEERSFADIGRALQLTENAARMSFERALEKLRVRLRRHGVTSTVAGLTLALANQATATVPAGLPAVVAGEALVGANLAGTALAAGSIGLMSSIKTLGAVAATLALFAVGVGMNETRSGRRTEATLAQLAPDIAALQTRRAVLIAELARPVPAPTNRAAKTATAAYASVASSVDAVSADTIARMNDAYETNLRLRTENPEYQRLYDRATRARTRLDYAGLYRTLALSPIQIEAFESIVAKNAGATVDLQGTIKSLGLKPEDPAIKKLTDRADREFRRELRDLLGPAGYEKYAQEESLLPVRSTVREIAGIVAMSEAPLTAAQGNQLARVIAQHTPNRDPQGTWAYDRIDWPALLDDAKAVLSPAQLDAFQGYAAQARYGAANIRMLNEARRP